MKIQAFAVRRDDSTYLLMTDGQPAWSKGLGDGGITMFSYDGAIDAIAKVVPTLPTGLGVKTVAFELEVRGGPNGEIEATFRVPR